MTLQRDISNNRQHHAQYNQTRRFDALRERASQNSSRNNEDLVDVRDASWGRSIGRVGACGDAGKLTGTSSDRDLEVVEFRMRARAFVGLSVAANRDTYGEAADSLCVCGERARLEESHRCAVLSGFGRDFVAVWSVCCKDLRIDVSKGFKITRAARFAYRCGRVASACQSTQAVGTGRTPECEGGLIAIGRYNRSNESFICVSVHEEIESSLRKRSPD